MLRQEHGLPEEGTAGVAAPKKLDPFRCFPDNLHKQYTLSHNPPIPHRNASAIRDRYTAAQSQAMASDTEGAALLAAMAARLMGQSSPQPTFVTPASKPVNVRPPPEVPRTIPAPAQREATQKENVSPPAPAPSVPAIKATQPTLAPVSSPTPPPTSAPVSPLVSRTNVEESAARGPPLRGDAKALAEAKAFLQQATGSKTRSRPGSSRGTSHSSESRASANLRPTAPTYQAASNSRTPPAPVRPVPAAAAVPSRPPPSATSNAWSSFAANPILSTRKPEPQPGSDKPSFGFTPPIATASDRAYTTASTTASKPPPQAATGSGNAPHLRMKQIAKESKLSPSEQREINDKLHEWDLLKEKDPAVFDVKARLVELDRQSGVKPAASHNKDTGTLKRTSQEKSAAVAKQAYVAPAADKSTVAGAPKIKVEEKNVKPPAVGTSAPAAASATTTAPLPTTATSWTSTPAAPATSAPSAATFSTCSIAAGDTQNLLTIIASLQTELQALRASVTYLEEEVIDTNARLNVVSIAEEKRRGLGTEDAKKCFSINVRYPNKDSRQIPVTGQTKVRDVIRRAVLEVGLKLTQEMKPTLTYAGEQYGHRLTLIECGIKEGCEVLFGYYGQEEKQDEEEEEEL